MNPIIKLLSLPDDATRLVRVLTAEPWPFHGKAILTEEDVLAQIASGRYSNDDQEPCLITINDEDVGILRIMDLSEFQARE